MNIDYNSPEMKIARVVLVLVVAGAALWWAAENVGFVKDILKSPGLSALKAIFLLMFFMGICLAIRSFWSAVSGKGSVGSEDKIFSYKAMAAEVVIAVAGLFLWWAAQAGWFGSGWTMFPV